MTTKVTSGIGPIATEYLFREVLLRDIKVSDGLEVYYMDDNFISATDEQQGRNIRFRFMDKGLDYASICTFMEPMSCFSQEAFLEGLPLLDRGLFMNISDVIVVGTDELRKKVETNFKFKQKSNAATPGRFFDSKGIVTLYLPAIYRASQRKLEDKPYTYWSTAGGETYYRRASVYFDASKSFWRTLIDLLYKAHKKNPLFEMDFQNGPLKKPSVDYAKDVLREAKLPDVFVER